ncbi:MAG TPA: DUF397 domain-containing protein [Pseudonocardiaceae bacterium]|jgi:hypothetical protein|nr:DUF397 domain-containing protein [Pseudonocardiaceae bacterium]
MMAERVWRKSSYTGAGADNHCVEIAWDMAATAIRDSKNPDAGTLALPQRAFRTLIAQAKTD